MANTSSIQKLLVLSVALVLGALLHVPSSQAATYTVSNTNDANGGSLRQAILDANGNAGIDTIDFSVSGTVNILSDLPSFSEAVFVDGRTAPNNLGGVDFIIGAAGRTYCLKFDAGAGNVVRGIGCQGGSQQGFVIQTGVSGATIGGTDVRDGNEIQGTSNAGIQISGADNVTIINTKIGTGSGCQNGISVNGGGGTVTNLIIGGSGVNERNVIVNSTQHGISILDASGVIKGNYIGTDGTNDNGNAQNGIMVGSGNTNLTIGGVNAGEGNVISGNNWNGVAIALSAGITVQGNYIGTNATGNAAIANSQKGIAIQTSNNVIGGNTAGARNTISGNTQHGINIDPLGGNITGNTIKGNYIGLNSNGNGAIANGQAGIGLGNGTITNTAIGGINAGEGNVISGNSADGISINGSGVTGTTIYGNVIGLQVDKLTAAPNANGISIVGDNTSIGQINVAGSRNIISSNNGRAIYINGADNTIIVNNYIGVAGDGVTQRPQNNQNAIEIDNTGASNVIGGTSTGALNLIATPANKGCIVLQGTAGNFNNFRQNTCLTSGSPIKTQAPANESLTGPIISTATTSYINGTSSVPNGVVDIFVNGVYVAKTAADALGNWERHMSITANSTVHATISNGADGTGSTSGTFAFNTISDATPPSIPTVASPANNSYTAATTINLSGTKEANTSIWIGGVQQVPNDALTTWSVANYAVVEGSNNLSIVAKDYASNSSSALSHSVTRDTVVPAAPILSYPSTSGASATITGSGTEVGAWVYINGVYTNVQVDGLGNFSTEVSLQSGSNSVSVTVVDNAGNTSTASIATITNGAGGGSGGGSSGGSGNSSSNNNPVGNDDTDEEAMAGEEEPEPVVIEPEVVVDPGVVVEPDTDTDTDTTPENTQTTEGSTSQTPSTSGTTTTTPVKNTQQPVKTFYSGIYQYVEPIKVPSIRDVYPVAPIKTPKYNVKVFENKFFGGKNVLGIPQLLIDIKGKGKDFTIDRDSDGDGAYDREELLYGGDIDVKDTDGDGYTDGDELFIYNTDPENYDTDGDGQSDSIDENKSSYDAGEVSAKEVTDYIAAEGLTVAPGVADTDEDGLSDYYELLIDTDPTDTDSDADGLSDGDEVMHYGSDPSTTTSSSSVDSVSIVNLNDGETVEATEQLFIGSVGVSQAEDEVTVQVYEVESDGSMTLVGESTADENGRYLILTDSDFEEGTHSFIVTTGESLEALTDLSRMITLNMVSYVKRPEYVSLGLQDGLNGDERMPTLALTAADNYMIVVAWRSTIYSQTLIADSAGQTINVKPVENLELGEHTVTWYAQDLETGAKSTPTQLSFEVTNTAFVTGETNSPWVIVLGSIAVLASLTALALFYRNRKLEA